MKHDKKQKHEDSDLADMREKWRQHKDRQNRGGGGGSNDWDKLGEGKNMRRPLPRIGHEGEKFYTEGWTHFGVGPNQRALRCIDEKHIDEKRGVPKPGTRCPLCKKFLREQARINSEYEKGDEDGQAEWKRAKDKYVPRHQFYMNVLVPDDDDDGVEVKVLPFGPQVWSQLMNFYLGDDTSIGDFTDPEHGRWVNFKKVKKGGRDRRNVGYEVYPRSEESDISDSWDDIKEMLHDLDAAAGQVMSKEEVLAIMKGVDVDKEDADDDEDDEEGKAESGDDSSDDGDDDDEDQPVKVKSSKLAKKMKKRRERDDEDE